MSRPRSFTPPPGVRAYQLRTERGEFAVLDAEPGPGSIIRPPVLLVPGYTGSKEDFIEVLAPLAAAGHRAVAVDGRGQYESRGPDDESAYSQEALARDVLAQAAALGGGPAHLVGHSFGGQVSRAAVLLDRAPFRTLTLMSSGPAEISPSQQARTQLLLDALPAMTMSEIWTVMSAMDAAQEAPAPNGEELRARWLLHNPSQLTAAARQLMTEPDRVGELAATRLPVHVVSGVTDDAWPVPLLDAMAERLAAHRTVVEGADHSPATDRPEITAKALIAFFAQY
ncbi:alpha/beta fold hydrolase [Streptomyces sp. GC420]|uniref:alpha/beta fold hydrolase n=1 Tax=Streptomyces sp. GC420 TaxID=2697568 RepID=UPI001414E24B|nr:alpha/beta hydrolase [Streptomyces sp. GC420]NBM16825.1 alpha/beta fold hydrolase [Streptomyces sp. GC420]